MKIPNLDSALVRESKITDYLLSLDHPVGKFKAAYFQAFGFSRDHWTIFRDALLAHATLTQPRSAEETTFGLEFAVDGPIHTPDGRNPRIRSVWIVRTGTNYPEFVTAYPLAREKSR